MTDHKNQWTTGVHHDSSEQYVSNPYPAAGETVTIQLRTPVDAPVEQIFLRSAPDGEIQLERMELVERNASTLRWAAPLNITMPRVDYRFKLLTDQGAHYYNACGISQAESPDWFDFTLLADYAAPHWVREMNFYQIFPDRFYNGDPSNDVPDGAWEQDGFQTQRRGWDEEPIPWEEGGCLDFFGGDLPGIRQKLPYLQELGITALYLTPIFKAKTNHHYDIMDYFQVAPHFGGAEALIELRRALDQAGMRLMLDVTPNHLGVSHNWFREAQANPDAPTAGFFTFYRHPDQYETWLGVDTLIKLDYSSQRLRELMYRDPDSVLRYWLREPYRIDGWRLDVANMMGNLGWRQLGAGIAREMRAALKQDNPAFYLMGEHFHDGTPFLQGDALDATMNYQGFNFPARRWLGGYDLGVAEGRDYGDPNPLPTAAMARQWGTYLAAVPFVIAQQQFNQLSSHDITRILSVVAGDVALAKLGMAMLFTFIGVPCLYYGDEIGMAGGQDPFNRYPMIWDERRWNRELLELARKLNRIRRASRALQQGGIQILYAAGDVICYQRHSRQQRIIFIGYRGADQASETTIPLWHGGVEDGMMLRDVLTDQTYTIRQGHIHLRRLQHGQFFILEETTAS